MKNRDDEGALSLRKEPKFDVTNEIGIRSQQNERYQAVLSDENTAENRWGWMRFGLIIGSIVTFIIVYPMLLEQAPGPCSALEYRVAAQYFSKDNFIQSNAFAISMFRNIVEADEGSLAVSSAKGHFPNLPPILACSAAY